MQEIFRITDNDERKENFYSKRNRFNELIKQSEQTEEKAALFIFLNKTCFNGLYNVPMGAYKKPTICDGDNIRLISGLLIHCGDYRECANFIDSNTFVYIDPPYRPLSETSSFTSYTNTEFGDEQQIQLGHFIKFISQKGAKIIANNSNPKNINENDNFFDDIYNEFIINRVAAARMINSNSKGRETVNELLICNY